MRIAEELYVAKNIENLGTIVYSLRRDIPVFRLYCLVVRTKRARLEIVSSKYLFQTKYANYAKTDGCIVGVAMGYQEALELLCFIVRQAVAEGHDLRAPISWFDIECDCDKEGKEIAESRKETLS